MLPIYHQNHKNNIKNTSIFNGSESKAFQNTGLHTAPNNSSPWLLQKSFIYVFYFQRPQR
ncbi:hypothetical protein E2C01_022827 [Portunus trituberculatus]|uniref:Uncharacterized protein n=1 Tax=Portunus trituberculatus TaxID=210409 RepID=A0A5B7E8P0_PORTR|nr:hypothetical protein [Portunus trituberculatus]